MMKRFLTAATVAAAVLCASPARAQSDTTLYAQKQVISANPFLFLANYFNAEYERAIGPATSAAVAGSYLSISEVKLFTVEGKARYYPQGRVLSGFAFGASLGFGQVSEDYDDEEIYYADGSSDVRFQERDDSASAFTVGVEADYNWLVGANRRFFIGSGIGVRRLFGGDIDTDVPVIIPTLRLVNIGFTF